MQIPLLRQPLRRAGLRVSPAVGVCLLLLLLSCNPDRIKEAIPEEKPPVEREDHGYASLYLNLKRPVERKDIWTGGADLYYLCDDGLLDVPGEMEIKLRGNATLGFPKKSYNIRFPEKKSVLGMPKDRRWCLLANWGDRTLLRNDLAFEISRRCGMEWTPSGEYVDLYVNKEYQGVYYVCEKVTGSSNRLDLKSDGFLLEQDIYYDEAHCFRTDLLDIPFMVKEPDEDEFDAEAYDAMRAYVNEAERLLVAGDTAWKRYLDTDSFARYWLVFELTQNWEPNNPKSCYMYMNPGGPLKAGPAWDFDWHTFIPGAEGFVIKDALWFRYLFRDAEFVRLVKSVWEEQRASLADLPAYLDERAERIRPYAQTNADMWPIPDQTDDWEQSIVDIRTCYQLRFAWLDKAIRAL